MTILFKFATRSRPEKCFAALDNIIENCASPDYKILLSIDTDDTTMMNNDVLQRLVSNYPQVIIEQGVSKCKVHAINRGVNDIPYQWDILCNHSDDMRFVAYAFDNRIREAFITNTLSKDSMPIIDLDRFIHFPDGFTSDKLCTYSIMGRVYYSRTNYIYHPSYKSLFSDNEATEVAQKLGKYIFVDKDILRHEHVANGHGEKDALLVRNEKYWHVDKKTYFKRKAKNFDL